MIGLTEIGCFPLWLFSNICSTKSLSALRYLLQYTKSGASSPQHPSYLAYLPSHTHVLLHDSIFPWYLEMSTFNTLRRRVLGDSSSEPSRAPSPNPAVRDRDGEPVTLVSTSKLKKLTRHRSKRRQWLVFGLGGLFGIILAAFFAQQHDVISLEGLMDIKLDSLLDAIPAGIVNDARDITVSFGQSKTYGGARG